MVDVAAPGGQFAARAEAGEFFGERGEAESFAERLAVPDPRLPMRLHQLCRDGSRPEVEASGQRRLVGAVDRLLGQARRDRALLGDVAGDALRLLEPGFLGDDPGDEAGRPSETGISKRRNSSLPWYS